MYNTKAKSASDVPTILIESKSLLREGLAICLESTRFRVIASGSSLDEAIPSVDHPPKLIVVEGGDLAIVTRVIQNCSKRYPTARPVVLGDHRVEHFTSLLQAGAHACVRRDITFEALRTSLELVMLGVKFICQYDASEPAENCQNGHIAETSVSNELGLGRVSHGLSKTEIAVLECLVQGNSNKVIARKRQIAEATVKVHIKSILRKIRAVNRTQAAIWAMTHLDNRAKSDESLIQVDL